MMQEGLVKAKDQALDISFNIIGPLISTGLDHGLGRTLAEGRFQSKA